MRRCEKPSKGTRWKVFFGVLSLSACLLVGSAIHVMLKAACVPAPPLSVITIKASAEAWTASESEKLYRVSTLCLYRKRWAACKYYCRHQPYTHGRRPQAFQDRELIELSDKHFSECTIQPCTPCRRHRFSRTRRFLHLLMRTSVLALPCIPDRAMSQSICASLQLPCCSSSNHKTTTTSKSTLCKGHVHTSHQLVTSVADL